MAFSVLFGWGMGTRASPCESCRFKWWCWVYAGGTSTHHLNGFVRNVGTYEGGSMHVLERGLGPVLFHWVVGSWCKVWE
jgi:hypothetical protein